MCLFTQVTLTEFLRSTLATGNQVNVLTLNLKSEYFEQIKAGTKTEEYRIVNTYWQKRIENRQYDQIHLLKGYPKKGDKSRTIVRPWRGYTIKTMLHPHFGENAVQVYAIKLTE